jgi:signal transduction histidine kinase
MRFIKNNFKQLLGSEEILVFLKQAGIGTWNNVAVLWMLLGSSIFSACQKDKQNAHEKQIQRWITQIEGNVKTAGVPRSMVSFDSLMATISTQGVYDKIHYYKFMATLCAKDSSYSNHYDKYIDSLSYLFDDVELRKQYPNDYSDLLMSLGDKQLDSQNYHSAYLNYFRGKAILSGIGEECQSARYTSRIAKIFFAEGKYYNAIEYWRKELKELEQCTRDDSFELSFLEKQGSLNNIGICFLNVNEPDSALHYFQRTMDFIKANEKYHPAARKFIKYAKLVVSIYQAEAYAAKDNAEMAEKLLRGSIAHDDDIDWSVSMEQDARLKLATLYVYHQRYSEASDQLDTLTQNGVSLDIEKIKRVNEMQAIVDLALGNFGQARDSLLATWKRNQIDTRNRNRDQKSDIGRFLENLQHDADMKVAKEQNDKQQIAIIMVAIIALSLLIITYQMFASVKRGKQYVRSLKKLNETISAKNDLLENTVDALEKMQSDNHNIMKVVAHDLRNPVGAIISASHLLFWEQEGTAEQAEMVDVIQRSGHKAIVLIEELLVSYQERKRLAKVPLHLDELIQSCIDMLSHKASEKRQTICFEREEVVIEADKKIWRVFGNLIGNAIKFSPIGGEIKVSINRSADSVLVSIADNGAGIAQETRDRIFNSEISDGKAGTAGEQSFGLGLKICKEVVDSHGGKLWFDSTVGAGTVFFVQMPL